MGRLTYLEMVNRGLRRITQSDITDVSSVAGHARIFANLLNEGLHELWTETNWHTLYRTRFFSTVSYTAATISFTSANPATISDSASGFGSFVNGQDIYVSGDSDNNGIYTLEENDRGGLFHHLKHDSQNLIIKPGTTSDTDIDIDADFLILRNNEGGADSK
jgi:hypothetical protein